MAIKGDLADRRAQDALLRLWRVFEHHAHEAGDGGTRAAQRQDSSEPRRLLNFRTLRSPKAAIMRTAHIQMDEPVLLEIWPQNWPKYH